MNQLNSIKLHINLLLICMLPAPSALPWLLLLGLSGHLFEKICGSANAGILCPVLVPEFFRPEVAV